MKRAILILMATIAASVLAITGIASAQGDSQDKAHKNAVQIAEDVTHEGAYYSVHAMLTVNGTINGDLYCMGQDITINGSVNGDVICAAQNIKINGAVSGDARLFAQNITVDSVIGGTLSAIGQNVSFNKNAVVGSDLNGAAQFINVSGNVGRDVALSASRVTVDGEVARNFEGFYDIVTITGESTVMGDARFQANSASIDQGAVSGEVDRTDPATRHSDQNQIFTLERALGAAMFVATALVLVLVLPGHVRRATSIDMKRFWLSTLVGAGIAIGTPAVALIFAITTVGLPIFAILMLLWAIVLLLATPLFGYYIGRQVLRGSVKNSIAIMAVGALVVVVVTSIPWLGAIIALVGGAAGIGMISFALSKRWVKPSYKETSK